MKLINVDPNKKSVNVLEVLDDAIADYTDCRFTDRHGTGPGLITALAAIAELIEADREYDEAKAKFDAAHQPAMHTRSTVAPKHGSTVVVAYHAAIERRAAALARVQGGA